MFLKKITSNDNITYFYLAKSFRDENGLPKHKIVTDLGKLSPVEAKNIANKLYKYAGLIEKHDLKDTELKNVFEFGNVCLIKYLWKQLQLGNIIDYETKSFKINFSVSKATLIMILNKCIDPASKHFIIDWQESIDFIDKFDYHQLLRALDKLYIIKESIELKKYKIQKELFKEEVKIIFYDVTSSYFEGNSAEIGEFGHSQDKRSDLKQVIIGLAVNSRGLPIYHEVYTGNKKDCETFPNLIDKISKDYEIKKCIFVADRGIGVETNKEIIKKMENMDYIFALRRRKLNEVKELILNIENQSLFTYDKIRKENANGKNEVKYHIKEIKKEDIRYLICHNEEVYKTDRINMAVHLRKLRTNLREIKESKRRTEERKYLVASKLSGVSRYFNLCLKENKFEYHLNKEKLTYEKLLLGKFVLKTEVSENELPKEEILNQYKNLLQVERAFKILKNNIELRPMYHWKERRIRAHILVCVLAYTLLKSLEIQLSEAKINLTATKVIKLFGKLKKVQIELEGYKIEIKSKLKREHKEILKAINCPFNLFN